MMLCWCTIGSASGTPPLPFFFSFFCASGPVYRFHIPIPTPSCHGDTPVPGVMVSCPFSSFFVPHVLSADLTPQCQPWQCSSPSSNSTLFFFVFCLFFVSFFWLQDSFLDPIPMPTPLISIPTGKLLLLSQALPMPTHREASNAWPECNMTYGSITRAWHMMVMWHSDGTATCCSTQQYNT